MLYPFRFQVSIFLLFLLLLILVAGCSPSGLSRTQGSALAADGTEFASLAGPAPPILPLIPTRSSGPERLLTTNVPFVPQPNRPRVPLSNFVPDTDASTPSPSPLWNESENLLVMGIDKREGETIWRTDVLMVIGIHREQGKAAMLSIPRDLYVPIPGMSPGRINTVDYLGEQILNVEGGGPALLSYVLAHEFGLRIDHWIRIEMAGIEQLVDALGGVKVHLDCPLYEPIINLNTGQWEYFTLPAGEVQMDGETAHWFVRLRIRESDIGRSRRQRQFLWALRNQALSTNLILRLPDLWNAFNNLYETDLGLIDIMNLARVGLSLNPENIHSKGLGYGELETFYTDTGAQVLRIKDINLVLSTMANVWNDQSFLYDGTSRAEPCKPTPTGPPVSPYRTPSPAQGEMTPTPQQNQP